MPAIEHSFSDVLPARIYLDTDVLIACLVRTEPHHNRCRAFLDRMVRSGSTRLCLSSLSWMEFIHVVTRDRFRRHLPDEQRQRFQLDRWNERSVRQTYLQAVVNDLEELLAQFEWDEIFLTTETRVLATQFIAEFNLGSHDAIHLATATLAGVLDFASLDEGSDG